MAYSSVEDGVPRPSRLYKHQPILSVKENSPTVDVYYTVMETTQNVRIEYLSFTAEDDAGMNIRITMEGVVVEATDFVVWIATQPYFVYHMPDANDFAGTVTRTLFGGDLPMDFHTVKIEHRHVSGSPTWIKTKIRFGTLQ